RRPPAPVPHRACAGAGRAPRPATPCAAPVRTRSCRVRPGLRRTTALQPARCPMLTRAARDGVTPGRAHDPTRERPGRDAAPRTLDAEASPDADTVSCPFRGTVPRPAGGTDRGGLRGDRTVRP